jgi:hypothetical protein
MKPQPAPPLGRGDSRNYDKPWLPPKKEKKEASSFLEYYYPDGIGPDSELI